MKTQKSEYEKIRIFNALSIEKCATPKRSVNNAVSWIGSDIFKKEVNCLFSGNGSVCLASGNGTEGYQKFVVDRSGIVKE